MKNVRFFPSVFLLLLVVCLSSGCASYKYLLPKGPDLTPPLPIAKGTDRFVIPAYTHTDRKHIRVWTHRPAAWTANDKVLVVMHGMSRNARDYMQAWVDIAERKNLLIIAPEFHNRFYKYTTNDYQDGNLFNFFGAPNPEEESAFRVIDNIIDHINQHNAFEIKAFDMFGHSAGGQFVHRMVMLHSGNRINKAIAANAGVYTFVDETGDYPYQLPDKNLDVTMGFKTQLIVLVGEQDTSASTGYLDQSPLAMRQGSNRLERGKRFIETSEAVARARGLDYRWSLQVVPNAGHNKALMIEAAAKLL